FCYQKSGKSLALRAGNYEFCCFAQIYETSSTSNSHFFPLKKINVRQVVMCVGYPDEYFEKRISGCEKISEYPDISGYFHCLKKKDPL
uniref:Uncharacterized protein n=1 Tax=Romanomermis culicivorax TaxID=13658 RepID=A0A915KER2_ROMCU